jgi:hypothetical protein
MKTMTPELMEELTVLASHHRVVAHYFFMYTRGEATSGYALAQCVLVLAEQNETLFRWVAEVAEGAERLRPDMVVDTRKETE